jgi:hypothetical protein
VQRVDTHCSMCYASCMHTPKRIFHSTVSDQAAQLLVEGMLEFLSYEDVEDEIEDMKERACTLSERLLAAKLDTALKSLRFCRNTHP